MKFQIASEFEPTGDQPKAIASLSKGIVSGDSHQTLLGVTGSGKTFTIANVVQETQRPTIVLAHNKTLAAQLYMEFQEFFPNNAVEYFVSYYDYYQPEAYLPTSGTYIEKDLSINEEIEKLRLSTSSALLSGRRDILVVASVSCLYGIGNPVEFHKNVIEIKRDENLSRTKFLHQLVQALYARTTADFSRGNFRVQGDVVDVFPAYADEGLRIHFFGDTVEAIETFDPASGKRLASFDQIKLYPANIFVTSPDTLNKAIHQIQLDLGKQVQYFQDIGKPLEAKRLKERTEFDIEMMKELGYCSGIENYSRYLDGRLPGTRPFCLLDYFPEDYLLVIDESHVTLPQVRAMYGGDRSRKENLVSYGFRLPAAMDNRPLMFEEFEGMLNQAIYVSATPADYEMEKSEGVIVEQIIRPTGLLDPVIEVRPSENQMDDLMEEIQKRAEIDERTLVTTLTKRMAEELTKYLVRYGVRTQYIHSDVDTLDRIQIMQDLRAGLYDVLVGVNLLREGLDLPEVSLVAILDADKEGFLRNHRSLTQTAGRAARNVNGKVIMYADKITDSMARTLNETERRREIQEAYNTKHGKTPQPLKKKINAMKTAAEFEENPYVKKSPQPMVKEEQATYALSEKEKVKIIEEKTKAMQEAAKNLDFLQAAKLRDEIEALKGE